MRLSLREGGRHVNRHRAAVLTGVAFLGTVLVDGALTGALYTLIALCFVIVYRASRMVNFALGEWTMLASALTVAAAHAVGLGVPAGLAAAVLAMVALGLGFNRLVLRPLIGRPLISLIMVTLGVGALLRGATGLLLHGIPGRIGLPVGADSLVVHGVLIPSDRLAAATVAALAVALVATYLHRSRTGLALRAIADDQQVAMAVGIDVGRHFGITWAAVGVLSVLAGALWSSVGSGGVGLVLVGLKVFPVVVLGGLDSVPGTLVAALLLGVLESVAASYLDPHVGGGFSHIASFLVLVAVLCIRPAGLFGRADVTRV